MEIKGFNKLEINNNVVFIKSEELDLIEKIEDILTSPLIIPIQMHNVIIDLLQSTKRETLYKAYNLYDEHINSSNPDITFNDKVGTARIMKLITNILNNN